MNRGTHIQKRTPKSKPGRTGDPQASYLLTNQYSSYHLRRTMNPNNFTPISTSNHTRGERVGNIHLPRGLKRVRNPQLQSATPQTPRTR